MCFLQVDAIPFNVDNDYNVNCDLVTDFILDDAAMTSVNGLPVICGGEQTQSVRGLTNNFRIH